MDFLKHFKDFLSGAPDTVQTPPPVKSEKSPATTTENSDEESTAKKQTGHIQRNKVSFRQVTPNDVIDESEEHWVRNGNVMEGDVVSTRVIAASGQVVKTSELQSVCTICNRLEDATIRSAISNVTLCRVCQRFFEKPDGEQIVVTPQELKALRHNFNTWERHDARAKGAK